MPGPERRTFSRRGALRGGLAAAGGLALAGSTLGQADAQADGGSSATPAPTDDGVVPFFDTHQAGVATAVQDRLVFAAFDLVAGSAAAQVRDLLQTWTTASAAMTLGQPVPGLLLDSSQPPPDTGEAAGLGPSHLTLTFGFGPDFFGPALGLAALRPAALVDLPPMPGEHLDPNRSDGDLCVQACADDPQVAFHAVRNLARLGRGLVEIRWLQLGFGRAASTSRAQITPRNLLGFKDGTNNLHLDDPTSLDQYVWVGDEGDQDWMRGGSYLVTRRIRMRLEGWDRDRLSDQERVIGRSKVTGAPLGGKREFDTVDLDAAHADGSPTVPADAHIRLAAPASNNGIHILRRGFSFTDGVDPRTGELDAGLFFICYQQDPRTAFIPIQTRLAGNDALNEYIDHVGSAIFACPPGITPDGFIADRLFAS